MRHLPWLLLLTACDLSGMYPNLNKVDRRDPTTSCDGGPCRIFAGEYQGSFEVAFRDDEGWSVNLTWADPQLSIAQNGNLITAINGFTDCGLQGAIDGESIHINGMSHVNVTEGSLDRLVDGLGSSCPLTLPDGREAVAYGTGSFSWGDNILTLELDGRGIGSEPRTDGGTKSRLVNFSFTGHGKYTLVKAGEPL